MIKRHRRLQRVTWVLVVAWGSAGGCGSSSSGESSNPETADQFKATLRAILCTDATSACCAGVGASFSKAACEQFVTFAVDSIRPQPAALNGAAPTFNKESARECVAEVKANASRCSFHTIFGSLDPPCGVVLSAAGPVGATCTIAADCAQPDGQSVVCEPASGLSYKCRTRTIVQAGKPCSGDAVCTAEGGLICRSDSHLCAPRSELGGVCAFDNDCPPLSPSCRGGVCVGRAHQGESCGLPTVPQICDPGLSCAGNVCAPAPRGGETCQSGPNACEDRGICTPISGSQSVCVVAIGPICSY